MKHNRFITIFYAFVLICAVTATAFAASDQQSETTIDLSIDNRIYTRNGIPAEFDVAPYIDPKANRTMAPIRFIAEAFGANVNWVDSEQTDYICLNNSTPLKILVGQPLPNDMGTAELVQDRLFVPIRYISEQLGAQVIWDAATRTVTISFNKSGDIVGGYTADRAITDDDLKVFNEAMNGLVGVGYEPTLVATQVVAGTNYRFTAMATPVILNPAPYKVYVYIYKPLQGPAQLIKIVN